jgi:hypothetical protein
MGITLPIAAGLIVGLVVVGWVFRGRPEIQAVRDAVTAAIPKNTPVAQSSTPAVPDPAQPDPQQPVAPPLPVTNPPASPLIDAAKVRRIVGDYVLKYAGDPKSIEFIEWSEPVEESEFTDDLYVRRCDTKIMLTARGRNALGGLSVSQLIYYLNNDAVVYSHEPGLLHQITPNYRLRQEFAPALLDPSVGPLTPEEMQKRVSSGVAP